MLPIQVSGDVLNSNKLAVHPVHSAGEAAVAHLRGANEPQIRVSSSKD